MSPLAAPFRRDNPVLAYNLTRVMNIVGIKPLMVAIEAWRALSRHPEAESAARMTYRGSRLPMRLLAFKGTQHPERPPPTTCSSVFCATKTQTGHEVHLLNDVIWLGIISPDSVPASTLAPAALLPRSALY